MPLSLNSKEEYLIFLFLNKDIFLFTSNIFPKNKFT